MRTLPLLLLFTSACIAQELRHDDGKMDDKRSMAGGAHVVLFERPDANYAATGLKIHGSRYGGGYDPFWALCRVTLRDERWNEIASTCLAYDAFDVGSADWTEIAIGPTRVPERFFAVLECFPERTKGIYVSIDGSTHGSSFVGSARERGNTLDTGTWMIRVDGTSKTLKVEQEKEDTAELVAVGEGDMLSKNSTAGMGHATLFKAPAGKKLLTKIELFGSRYGGDYDPETTLFHVFVCDKKLDPIARMAYPYALFDVGDPDWVTIDLPDLEVPASFAVLVYFAPTQTQGVYVGRWKEKRTASLHALPGKVDRKVDGGEGWMMRVEVAKSQRGELPPWEGPGQTDEKKEGEASDESWDAIAIADALEAIDEAERTEDIQRARELTTSLREHGSLGTRVPTFDETAHFILRREGMVDEAAQSLLRIMEAGHTVLTEEMGFEHIGLPSHKVHLLVTIEEGARTSLFTNPRSTPYSQIVLRGPARALRSPANGGPHVVYGFLHELGHVIIGWEDSEHQWAHWLGSHLASRVHGKLGKDVWFEPYDVTAIEGMPRFEKEVRNAEPGLGSAPRVGKLFLVVANELGVDAYARSFAWIVAHRDGKPFHAVRLYRLDDLRAALVAQGYDESRIARWFA